MEAPLAALRELEMLDRVGDVDLAAFDSGLVERAIEHPPRRADEGATGQILLIARLLADQHDRGADGAFAEHRLRRVLLERATRAALRLVAKRCPGWLDRKRVVLGKRVSVRVATGGRRKHKK